MVVKPSTFFVLDVGNTAEQAVLGPGHWLNAALFVVHNAQLQAIPGAVFYTKIFIQNLRCYIAIQRLTHGHVCIWATMLLQTPNHTAMKICNSLLSVDEKCWQSNQDLQFSAINVEVKGRFRIHKVVWKPLPKKITTVNSKNSLQLWIQKKFARKTSAAPAP